MNNNGNQQALVQQVWNYAHVLRGQGISYGDYIEQITYLLFLKMDQERTEYLGEESATPKRRNWSRIASKDGDPLELQYRHTLENLGKEDGLIGTIFRKAQNKLSDPAKLKRVASLIDKEGPWIGLNVDVKGEIVDEVVRLCAMNLYLHGIGNGGSPVHQADALAGAGSERYNIVLTNPPFGKKSSYRVVGEDGQVTDERENYERENFKFTTSNKQFNFLQHMMTILKVGGRAAVVMPDNVLFEAGRAGEGIRKRLLENFNFHTLLRLPTGIWYSPGVKANVLLFDKKPASKEAQTKELWVYDYRTNVHKTLKTKPLARPDLDDFVECYRARKETDRFRAFHYDELIKRDKLNLDLFWLKDNSLEDIDALPEPSLLVSEIIVGSEAALKQFQDVESEI